MNKKNGAVARRRKRRSKRIDLWLPRLFVGIAHFAFSLSIVLFFLYLAGSLQRMSGKSQQLLLDFQRMVALLGATFGTAAALSIHVFVRFKGRMRGVGRKDQVICLIILVISLLNAFVLSLVNHLIGFDGR